MSELLVTLRYTFGPEHTPASPYCWSCMSEKKPGTVMRTAQPPAPPHDFCPSCVELCNTTEKIKKEPIATSKDHPGTKAAKKREKKRSKRQRNILPEEE